MTSVVALSVAEVRRSLTRAPLPRAVQAAADAGYERLLDPGAELPLDAILELAQMIDVRPLLSLLEPAPVLSRSDDLVMMAPVEHPRTLLPDFVGRVADAELTVHDVDRGEARLMVLIDESASTLRPSALGLPAIFWAKAILARLLTVTGASVQVIGFSGPKDHMTWESACSVNERSLTHYFGRGTDLTAALDVAKRSLEAHQCWSSAVVILSDWREGLAVPPPRVSDWRTSLRRVNARCVGITLGTRPGDSLAQVCESVLRVQSLITLGK